MVCEWKEKRDGENLISARVGEERKDCMNPDYAAKRQKLFSKSLQVFDIIKRRIDLI